MHVQGVLVDVELNQRMTEVCRNSVRAFVEDRVDSDGRVSIKALNKFAQMTGFGAQEPWNDVIKVQSHVRDMCPVLCHQATIVCPCLELSSALCLPASALPCSYASCNEIAVL